MYLMPQDCAQASARKEGFPNKRFAGPAVVLRMQGVKQVTDVILACPPAVLHP